MYASGTNIWEPISVNSSEILGVGDVRQGLFINRFNSLNAFAWLPVIRNNTVSVKHFLNLFHALLGSIWASASSSNF